MVAKADLLITARDLVDLLAANSPSLAILDCRFNLMDENEGQRLYAESHIPGAHYLHLNRDLSGRVVKGITGRHPLPEFSRLVARLAAIGINSASDIVVYDQSQAGYAGRCWWLLRHLGLKRVRVLDGGFKAWQSIKGPLTAEAPIAKAQTWSPEPRQSPVADRDDIARLSMALAPTAWATSPVDDYGRSAQLLDARDRQRYLGHHEPIDAVAGHIPGALCRPFTDNLDDSGCFLSAETLRAQFFELGIQEGAHITCYCGSGVTATVNILGLLLAGFDEPALYPGSFSDWITDPQHPVGGANDQLPS